jgi:hypothetical protein
MKIEIHYGENVAVAEDADEVVFTHSILGQANEVELRAKRAAAYELVVE